MFSWEMLVLYSRVIACNSSSNSLLVYSQVPNNYTVQNNNYNRVKG